MRYGSLKEAGLLLKNSPWDDEGAFVDVKALMQGQGIADFSRSGDNEKAPLRARAEALASENNAPLPAGDAGLIEAERRRRESRLRCSALYLEFSIDFITEREIINKIIDPQHTDFAGSLKKTPPTGIASAAAKLRYLIDHDIGIVIGEPSEGDITCLKQVAGFVE